MCGEGELVGGDDGIRQAADAGNHGNSAVTQGTKLRQSAWLEPRWYQERVRACLNKVGQVLVIADENADLVRMRFCGRAKVFPKVRLATPQQDQLHGLAQAEWQIFQE